MSYINASTEEKEVSGRGEIAVPSESFSEDVPVTLSLCLLQKESNVSISNKDRVFIFLKIQI
jgi:hypothetical protein